MGPTAPRQPLRKQPLGKQRLWTGRLRTGRPVRERLVEQPAARWETWATSAREPQEWEPGVGWPGPMAGPGRRVRGGRVPWVPGRRVPWGWGRVPWGWGRVPGWGPGSGKPVVRMATGGRGNGLPDRPGGPSAHRRAPTRLSAPWPGRICPANSGRRQRRRQPPARPECRRKTPVSLRGQLPPRHVEVPHGYRSWNWKAETCKAP
jgi:hypothetical protein